MVVKDEQTEKTTYEPVKLGSHLARCFAVVDLGVQAEEWQGNTRSRRKVLLGFEILDDTVKIDGEDKPKLMTTRLTYSVAEKSRLRAILVSWKGYTDAQFREGVDVASLVGEPCIISVSHTPKNDGSGVWANIQSVSDVLAGITIPEPKTAPCLFEFPRVANLDKMSAEEIKSTIDKANALPEMYRIRDLVTGSDTYKDYQRLADGQPAKPKVIDSDDELPF